MRSSRRVSFWECCRVRTHLFRTFHDVLVFTTLSTSFSCIILDEGVKFSIVKKRTKVRFKLLLRLLYPDFWRGREGTGWLFVRQGGLLRISWNGRDRETVSPSQPPLLSRIRLSWGPRLWMLSTGLLLTWVNRSYFTWPLVKFSFICSLTRQTDFLK